MVVVVGAGGPTTSVDGTTLDTVEGGVTSAGPEGTTDVLGGATTVLGTTVVAEAAVVATAVVAGAVVATTTSPPVVVGTIVVAAIVVAAIVVLLAAGWAPAPIAKPPASPPDSAKVTAESKSVLTGEVFMWWSFCQSQGVVRRTVCLT